MALDIFALIVMGVLIAVVVWFIVLLGPMPGRIATDRGHPQPDAIRVLGWIGLITLGLAWPFRPGLGLYPFRVIAHRRSPRTDRGLGIGTGAEGARR